MVQFRTRPSQKSCSKSRVPGATGSKKQPRLPPLPPTEVIGVSRSNLVERLQQRLPRQIGRPPLPDKELVAQIKTAIAELPTYGYRRVHAILKRQALAAGLKPPNHKRVYRVIKVHSLLDRYAGGVERRHDGRIAVGECN